MEEIESAKAVFKKNRLWPVFDVTGKALEETATEVEKVILTSFPEKLKVTGTKPANVIGGSARPLRPPTN